MREAVLNRLGFGATDCVRWNSESNAPDSLDFIPANYLSGQSFASDPIAIQSMELTTLQPVYTPDPSQQTPDDWHTILHLQCSQDGSHWDDVPDSQFDTDLSTLLVDATHTSFTIELLLAAAYIRVILNYGWEGPVYPGDSLRIYLSMKEA